MPATERVQTTDSALELGRKQYVQQHPDLSQSTKDDILAGHIHVGMTCDQIRASWGRPDKINRPGDFGADESWEYGTIRGGIAGNSVMPQYTLNFNSWGILVNTMVGTGFMPN